MTDVVQVESPRVRWALLFLAALFAGLALLSWREAFAEQFGTQAYRMQIIAWPVGILAQFGLMGWVSMHMEVIYKYGDKRDRTFNEPGWMLVIAGILLLVVTVMYEEGREEPLILNALCFLRTAFWGSVGAILFGMSVLCDHFFLQERNLAE